MKRSTPPLSKTHQISESDEDVFTHAEWEKVPYWRKKLILFQAKFNFEYPYWKLLYARFESPFSFASWRAAIPGFLMALVIGLFALTLSSENRLLLIKNWNIYSSVFFLLFGILAAIEKSSNHIFADDYLSVSAFWLHCTWLAAIFKTASILHPLFALAYFFCFAAALAMINILTCYYFLSLFFKYARI